MPLRLFIAIALFSGSVSADEYLREGEPKRCFLFSWGKGPNWETDVTAEFHLRHLESKRPYVDDTFLEPTSEALTWWERSVAPTISEIARVDGKKVLRVDYPIDGDFGRTIECVMLAIEISPKSKWFAPFFVAQPELFSGRIVSSESLRIGYVASLEFSGTGAFRNHYLFDLTEGHPHLIDSVSAGRVRPVDFEEEEYEKALKTFDHEAKLLMGEPYVEDQAGGADGGKPETLGTGK